MAPSSAADLAGIAADLYALDLGEFTAERNARAKAAKAAGDAELSRQLARLPKPSTAAWLVNQLGRHHGDELAALLEVGAALREAQANLDADELKALGTQRRKVIGALGRQARALARTLGHPVGEGIVAEVEQTLHAAMVDAGAAAAVRSGRLVAALSPAGFGSVDLAGALAVPDAPADQVAATAEPQAAEPQAADLERRRARKAAQAAAAEAKQAARHAAAALTSATRAAETAAAERDRRADSVRTLESQLERARAALDEAENAASSTAAERDRTGSAASQAEDDATRAAEALAALDP